SVPHGELAGVCDVPLRSERMLLSMKTESKLATTLRVGGSAHLTNGIRQKLVTYALALAIVLGLAIVAAPSAQAQTFDVTGAGTGKNEGTFPFSINTAGIIAGYYCDASNWYHGFVRAKNGTITTFDVPGALEHFDLGTAASSINTAGDVTGIYRDTSFVHHGFVRGTNGTITTFDAPGAGTGTYEGTEPIGI